MGEMVRCGKSILCGRFFRIAGILPFCLLLAVCCMIISGFSFSESNELDGEEDACKYYTSIEIEVGDSLWSIASEYMTDDYKNVQDYIEEIKSLNKLSGDKIHAGNYLVIPYYSQR